MYKRLEILFLTFLMYLMIPMNVYGAENKIILLVVSQGSWDVLINSPLVSSLVSKSAIGSMSIRTNHKNRIIEHYGTINAGRRWSYYEINDMGAVENGLGDLLSQSNFSTAIFSDHPNIKKIIENSSGEITYQSKDFEVLYSEDNMDILKKADIILIEMDLYNTRENQNFLLDFINQNKVQLYLFCPYDREKNSELTPFLFYDSANPQPGLVSANTTRRPGIITSLDIAPTILNQLKIDYSGMISKGITIHSSKNAFSVMIKDLEKIKQINSLRSLVIKVYTLLLITCAAFFLLINQKSSIKVKKIYNSIILSILWIPVLMMLHFQNMVVLLLSYIIVLLTIIYLGMNMISSQKTLKVTSGTLLMIFALDTLLGSPLMRNSFLGYDPVIGARFYGIGNEYAGIIIGNLYLFLYSIGELRYFRSVSMGLQIFFILLLGMSLWGANFGGMLAALSGMLLFYFHHYRNKARKYTNYAIIAALFLFAVLWIILDCYFIDDQSHLGQTISQLLDGNSYLIAEVIKRKLAMNLQLIKYSMWSKFLIVALIILGIYFDIKHPIMTKVGPSWIGAMSGAVFFNDSGIVMCATCMIYLVFPYLYVYNQNK
ncbi:MAG TPA: hypothetical protein GXX16_03210 [Epulopiscium sp.]|nr:hypothetical protein [Candidatus Epulonipiscium sp.]